MKKLFYLAGLLTLVAVTPTFGADKTVTITGQGQCGKCSLKETKACQNVIVTEKNGAKETYYLVQNDVSKKFHENVCKETKKVTATGTVKEVDGKKELTATKIELAKD